MGVINKKTPKEGRLIYILRYYYSMVKTFLHRGFGIAGEGGGEDGSFHDIK